MTSVQTKKGAGGKEEDRQQILRQMKVRTKLKTDKSWIQHQSSEEEADGAKSPQLKSLEARKSLWSPTADSKPDRNSGFFASAEVSASSSVSPVQSSNKRFSYNPAESYTPPSPTSKPSPPPSTASSKPVTSYIIRGQTLNAVSQVNSPPSFNGYQKSVVQGRTNSLPRIQTATGYKMSTEEYKKLAPYNVRNKSEDLSDDEVPFTPQEQAKRTEQASNVLRNTTSKERSYVVSAAKRNSGVGTQELSAPFVAKRVEIQEEISPERKSQSLPKGLANYLYEDANKFENSWKETQSKQTPSQTSPPRFENSWKETQSKQTPSQTSPPSATERSGSPRLSSYGVSGGMDGRRSPVRPDAGRITVSKEERKLPAEGTTTTTIRTTRTESATEREGSPHLSSYGVSAGMDGRRSPVRPDAGRITVSKEESYSKEASKPPAEGATTTHIRTTITESKEISKPPAEKESPKNTRTTRTGRVEATENTSETLPHSLESFLYEDASRYESNWKSNQANPPTLLTTSSRTSDRPESPKLIPRGPEKRTSPIKPEPAKITVLREESDNVAPKPTEDRATIRTIITTAESENADIPKLTSYKDITEIRSSSMQTGPGKITVLKEESNRETPKGTSQSSASTSSTTRRTVETRAESDTESSDFPKLVSCSISNTLTESAAPIMQTGPGKISLIREDSPPPKPVPRGETKPKEATSDKTGDLISWSDLDNSDSRLLKEKPAAAPKPVPRGITRESERVTFDAPLIVSSPDLHSNRATPPPGPASISAVHETRYRVPEILDESEPEPLPRSNLITSDPENRNVRIKIETLSEAERSSAPRVTSDPENRNVRIKIETLSEAERSSAPRITPDQDNGNFRIKIETLSERPGAPEAGRSSSPSEKLTADAPLIVTSPDLQSNRATQPAASASISPVHETRYRVPEILDEPEPRPRTNLATQPPAPASISPVHETRYRVPEILDEPEPRPRTNPITSDRENSNVRITIETLSERPTTPERSSSPRPSPRARESTTTTTVTESRHRVPETLEDTMLEASPARSSSRTTVTTTRSTDPVYTEYAEDRDARSTRTTSSSREKITTTTTTTVESRYDHAASQDSSLYDPQSPSNKGVLFVKEYVNTSENVKSPTTAGNLPDFSGDSEILSHSTNSSYLYNSAPRRSDEGPCSYCGREIKDCAKIILEHLNIYCHEYCFKCGICNKPMGDLMDNLFIHRQVVHCESCYEKLF